MLRKGRWMVSKIEGRRIYSSPRRPNRSVLGGEEQLSGRREETEAVAGELDQVLQAVANG